MDMSQDPASKIVSRRSRPAKAPLSRDAIVSTALRILEKDGLPGLSLRRVATDLDTGAASLYVYMTNLEELHSLMLDQALAAVRLPKVRGSRWQDRLKLLLRSYFDALYNHRGLAQLAMSTISTGPNSLGIWEMLLGLLKEGGVDDVQAAWGVDLLTLHVTAVAAEQSLRRESGPVLGRVENALSAVSEKDFPLVFASKKALLSGDGATRSEWALGVILAGIVSTPPPVSKLRGNRRRK